MTIAVRPPVPGALPADRGWVAKPDDGWRLNPTGTKCRRSPRQPCPNAPVAEFARTRWTRNQGRVISWWAYCAEHMFGRWIENGQVMHWAIQKEPA